MAHPGNTITDIDIPFGRVVAIQIKWMLAAVPAMVVLSLVWLLLAVLVTLAMSGGDVSKLRELIPAFGS